MKLFTELHRCHSNSRHLSIDNAYKGGDVHSFVGQVFEKLRRSRLGASSARLANINNWEQHLYLNRVDIIFNTHYRYSMYRIL